MTNLEKRLVKRLGHRLYKRKCHLYTWKGVSAWPSSCPDWILPLKVDWVVSFVGKERSEGTLGWSSIPAWLIRKKSRLGCFVCRERKIRRKIGLGLKDQSRNPMESAHVWYTLIFLCSGSEHKSEHWVYPLLEHFCVLILNIYLFCSAIQKCSDSEHKTVHQVYLLLEHFCVHLIRCSHKN